MLVNRFKSCEWTVDAIVNTSHTPISSPHYVADLQIITENQSPFNIQCTSSQIEQLLAELLVVKEKIAQYKGLT